MVLAALPVIRVKVGDPLTRHSSALVYLSLSMEREEMVSWLRSRIPVCGGPPLPVGLPVGNDPPP